MIKLQLLFLFGFVLNLLLIWVAIFVGKFNWYKPLGGLILNIWPFFTVFLAQPVFELDYFWWKIAGFVALFLGLALMCWSALAVRKQGARFRFDQAAKGLVTSGPYQFVRHPYYLSLIFIWVGWWWVWAGVYSFYFGMLILACLWIQASLEERLLLVPQFGEKYHEYKRQTGMFWIK